jgi:hypothetical protein
VAGVTIFRAEPVGFLLALSGFLHVVSDVECAVTLIDGVIEADRT